MNVWSGRGDEIKDSDTAMSAVRGIDNWSLPSICSAAHVHGATLAMDEIPIRKELAIRTLAAARTRFRDDLTREHMNDGFMLSVLAKCRERAPEGTSHDALLTIVRMQWFLCCLPAMISVDPWPRAKAIAHAFRSGQRLDGFGGSVEAAMIGAKLSANGHTRDVERVRQAFREELLSLLGSIEDGSIDSASLRLSTWPGLRPSLLRAWRCVHPALASEHELESPVLERVECILAAQRPAPIAAALDAKTPSLPAELLYDLKRLAGASTDNAELRYAQFLLTKIFGLGLPKPVITD